MRLARVCAALAGLAVVHCAAPVTRLPYKPPPVVAQAPERPLPAPRADGRLPSFATPLHYALDLTVDPRESRYLGRVRIDLRLDRGSDHVVLHAAGPKLLTAAVRERGAVHWVKHRQRPGPGALAEELVLQFARPLGPGVVQLDLEFDAPFSDGLRGLYRVRADGHAHAFSQLEPSDARRAFPCFDEPGFKTPFDVTLTVPNGYLALANAPPGPRRTQLDSGLSTTQFATTPPLPTYLVALAVGPLSVTAGPPNPTPLAVVSLPGKEALAPLALAAASSQLELLERYFGQRYAHAKLDLVAVPEMSAGAMENPGLVTFREELLLLDETRAGAKAERGLARIMAHELAHQWFGNLVTPKWWDDLWLNEGLASWMGEKIADQNRPGFALLDEAAGAKGLVMQLDALPSARRVREPVRTPSDVLSAFDTITYVKGAAVIRMVEAWLGPEVTQRGMQRYVRRHAHGNASAADLFQALEAESGKAVSTVFSSFVDQSGVPLLQLDVECRGDKSALTVAQREWLPLGRDAAEPKYWSVPVCIRGKTLRGLERVCVLSTQPTQRHELPLSSCPSLWAPNDDETGYYRAALTPAVHKALARAAPKFLSTRERAGLVSSSFALVEAGQASLARHLELLRALSGERQRGVWLEVLRQLRVVDFWVTDAARAGFARFVRSLIGPAARRLTIVPKAGEGDDVRLLRAELWVALAELGDDQAAQAELRRLALAWLQARDRVHPDLARVALERHAARSGGPLRARLLSQLAKAELPEHRMILLAGLSGFEHPAQVRAVLDASLTEALRVQELRDLYLPLLGRASTAALAAQWMLEHAAPLRAKLPNFSRGRLIASLGAACDANLAKSAGQAIAGNGREGGQAKMPLSRAVEQAKLCAAARQAHRVAVTQAFRR
jgi:aminopeptidase N